MFGRGRNCDVEAFRGGILSLVPAWCKSETDFSVLRWVSRCGLVDFFLPK